MKLFAAILIAGVAASLLPACVPAAGAATETVLYSFCIQQGCTDGEYPFGGLLRVKGTLYATTYTGGPTNNGAVISLPVGGGAATILHSFDGNDGSGPYAALIKFKGALYGTTQGGGDQGRGTVFVIDPKNGKESVFALCRAARTVHPRTTD